MLPVRVDGLDRGSIYALQADRPGRAVWRQSVGQVWDLAVDAGRLFVGTNGHGQGVQAYDVSCARDGKGTCKPLWTASTACCTQLVATGGVVLAHDHVSSVYEFPEDCRSDGKSCVATWTSSVVPPSDPYGPARIGLLEQVFPGPCGSGSFLRRCNGVPSIGLQAEGN